MSGGDVSHAVEILQPVDGPALISAAEQAYITETPTGLAFAADTPIEVWSGLVTWLLRAHKRLEWAIGDALAFGEHHYGETYAQWADETGLAENTLATMKWVAGAIEPLRRREGVGWSHHREVAALPAAAQDRLLDCAAEQGLTRWEVRQAVKVERERQRGLTRSEDGAPPPGVPAPGVAPTAADLVDACRARLEARLSGMGARYRVGFEAGWIAAHVEANAVGCFRRTD